ncbi:MAG: hypothetical protein U0931_15495 [Vulcanimicrobiota bacterium]
MNNAIRALLLALLVVLVGELIHHPFFFRDDQQAHCIPGFTDVARAWRAGQVPLVSPYSWCAGGLAGEYQYGIFNPLVQLPVVLTSFLPDLAWRSTLLVLVFAWMTVWGAVRLGQQLGLDRSYSLALGAAFCFNRYSMDLGWRAWLPMAMGSIWIPWFWAACASRQLWLPGLVLSLVLVLTAGWPFAIVATATLGVFYVVQAMLARQWRRAAVLVVGASCALLWSAPCLGTLLEYSRSSLRDREASGIYRLDPLDGLVYCLPGLSFKSRDMDVTNLLLNIGWIPCLGILGAILQRRPAHALTWLALLWYALAISPSFGGMRFSSRWLQYLNPMAALLGLAWLQRCRPEHRFGPSTWAALILAQLLGPALDRMHGVEHRWELGPPLLLGIFVLAWNQRPRLRPQLVLAGTLAGLFLSISPQALGGHEYPIMPVPADSPVRNNRCWLSLYTWSELQSSIPQLTVLCRYGNAGMDEQIETVNGYSPLFATQLIWAWTFSNVGSLEPTPWSVQNIQMGCLPGGLLDKLGVSGLLVSPDWRALEPFLQRSEWKQSGSDGLIHVWTRERPRLACFESIGQGVYHQEWQDHAALALVPKAPAALKLDGHPNEAKNFARLHCQDEVQERNRAWVQISANNSDKAALVAVHRPWVEGYRATLNGQPLPLAVMNLCQMAVEIPAGSPAGRLEVAYRPLALRYAPAFLLLGLLAGLAAYRLAGRADLLRNGSENRPS